MIDKSYRDALAEAEVRMSVTSDSYPAYPYQSETRSSGTPVSVTVAVAPSPCPVCGSTTPGRHYAPDDLDPMTRRARVLYVGFLVACLAGAILLAWVARRG